MEKTLSRNENCQAMAGIASVYYADINIVNVFDPVQDGVKCTIHSGHAWSEIEHDGATANATPEDGHAYRHVVECVYHGSQQEMVRTLDEMSRGRYLVRVSDNNGTDWVYGTPDTPLHMSFESVNDGEEEGDTSYKLRFEALCPAPEMRMY